MSFYAFLQLLLASPKWGYLFIETDQNPAIHQHHRDDLIPPVLVYIFLLSPHQDQLYSHSYVFEQLWHMIRRRHRNKSKKRLFKKYWTASGIKYVFAIFVKPKNKKGVKKMYQVVRTTAIGIRRHKKIIADVNPYLPKYGRYFWFRRHVKEAKLWPKLRAGDMLPASWNEVELPGCPTRVTFRNVWVPTGRENSHARFLGQHWGARIASTAR